MKESDGMYLDTDEETIEERTRRYAQNRYDLRMAKRYRLEDTEKDDWAYAEDLVRREIYGH